MKKIIAMILVAMFALAGIAMAEEKVLTIATNVAFAPYEYYDVNENGDEVAMGIDIEIVEMICAEMGYKTEVKDMDFGAVVSGVAEGKYDIGVGAITITPERKQSVNFTDAYEVTVQQVVYKEGGAIVDVASLNAAEDFEIGVQQDTTGDFYATDTFEAAGKAEVKRYKTGIEAIMDLNNGKIDCVIIDNGPALAYASMYEGLALFASECDSEEYGFCFNKEDVELFEQFNAILKTKLEDGTVAEIIAKYNAKMIEIAG